MNSRTMTAEQMHLLSQIFRVILKEIKTGEDKEKLAPGEIGISYTEGTLYVKNPYTGELTSPNSIEHVSQILSKFNPKSGKLDADTVSYIKFYSSTNQLDQVGTSMTADTIIRQMDSPSILHAIVEYDNPEAFGFPSKSGLLSVVKLDPAFVTAVYHDLDSNTTYDGYYMSEEHMLYGWIPRTIFNSPAITTTGGTVVRANYGKEYTDLDIVPLYTNIEIMAGATLTLDGKETHPITHIDGNPLKGIISANNVIMLIYDGIQKSWIFCPSNVNPQTVINQMLAGRIKSI